MKEGAGVEKIFGLIPVMETLRAGNRYIEKILVAESSRENRIDELLRLAAQKNISIERVSRGVIEKAVARDANHQGVVAFVSTAIYKDASQLIDSLEGNSLSLVLDGIEDPRNFGAILRTAECAGVETVFVPERRAVGLTETVLKTSAGASEFVRVARVTNISRLLEELKGKNIWTIGTSADAKMSYSEWDWTQSSALVLGNEGRGLHRLVAENCDALVKIPMFGKVESLNVSVAAGVILFEAQRQRTIAGKKKS